MNTQTPTFDVTIYIHKDAAALAGLESYGRQTFPINPATLTTRQRQTLVTLNYSINQDYTGFPISGAESVGRLLDAAADVLDAKRAKESEENSRTARHHHDKIMTAPLADKLSVDAKTGMLTITKEPGALVALVDNPPHVERQWAGVWGLWDGFARGQGTRADNIRHIVLANNTINAKLAEADYCARLLTESLEQARLLRKTRADEEVAQQEREESEAKARRKAQLAAFVAEHMTPIQQRRFEAGMMANAEIIEAIADQAFMPASHFEVLQCIRRADVMAYTDALEVAYDRDEGITVGQRPADTLTDAEFEQLEGLKAIFDGCTVEAVEHFGYMDSLTNMTDPELTVNVARVKLTIGDVKVMRDFVLAAGGDQQQQH